MTTFATATDYTEKLQAAKEKLGTAYLLHPDNQVKKKRIKKTTFQKFHSKVQKKASSI